MNNSSPLWKVRSLGWLLIPLVALVVLASRGDLRIAYGASDMSNPSDKGAESAQDDGSATDDSATDGKDKAANDQRTSKEAANDKPSQGKRTNKGNKVGDDQTDDIQEDGKVVRTDREWRRRLSREEYRILRQKGTERPHVNKYDHHFEPGAYACAGCGQILFTSDTKFNSGCGWPAFYAAEAGDRVNLTPDYSLGMVRTEVTCAKCDGHLGHIFDDAPQTPTGQRYCINSVSLKFIPADEDESEEKGAAEPQSDAKKKPEPSSKIKTEKQAGD